MAANDISPFFRLEYSKRQIL